MEIIGRTRERNLFDKLVKEDKSHFASVYGRRRIGKTFLIRSHFKEFTFYHTGIINLSLKDQLIEFDKSLSNYSKKEIQKSKSWFEAFETLQQLIKQSKRKKKVIFIDELPWLDTPKSKFLSALDYFWNSFASGRKDILLIVCGSATSWIVKKIFNNKGGLHNRVTQKIKLKPFKLAETETFLTKKGIHYNRYQIVKAYMAFGGIPYYLDAIEIGKSIDQNIDNLYFNPDGLLFNEYQNLFHALFTNAEKHIEIVAALASKNKGLTRDEIVKSISSSSGGTVSKTLEELELSDFIRTYSPFEREIRGRLYQLTDAYTLFYHNFLNHKKIAPNFWTNAIDSPKVRAWSGYAFEMVCLMHSDELKKALQIAGIQSEESSWVGSSNNKKAQIDLLLDRRDQVITIFEIKFSSELFTISKKYHQELLEKKTIFRESTKTKKAIFMAMITTYGIFENEYKNSIQNELTLDNLF
jgi:hypothetical protein